MKKIAAVLLLFSQMAHGQGYFTAEFINCVVSLEKEDSTGAIIPHGTGFSIYNYENPDELIIATNEHVLRNGYIYLKTSITDSAYEFMTRHNISVLKPYKQDWVLDGHNLHVKIILEPGMNFIKHESLDIALFKVQKFYGIYVGSDSIKILNLKSVPLSNIIRRNDIALGAPAYFIGFPLTIGHSYGFYSPSKFNEERLNPLIRKGIVAWKSDRNKEFLLDAFSFSGNSGSPVFSEAGMFGEKPGLIGIVFGHLGQGETNTGLAKCYWIDEILELIKRF